MVLKKLTSFICNKNANGGLRNRQNLLPPDSKNILPYTMIVELS